MISKYYLQLNNKNWLIENYITKQQSTNQLAKELNCNSNSIRQALKGFNIEIRNSSKAQRINQKTININHDVICGCLLGDASLIVYNKQSNISCAYFLKSNKHIDHIEYISKQFYPNNFLDYITPLTCKLNGKIFKNYRFRSLAYEELTPYYQNWYPISNNFKKIVPKNFKLTSEIIHHWFLDDGCASYIKKKHKWFVNISFSSESFTKNENEFLVKQLNNLADLNAKVVATNSGTGWRIKINASHTHKFYNLIGPSIIPNLAYKWKEHLSDHVDSRDTLQYKQVKLLIEQQ